MIGISKKKILYVCPNKGCCEYRKEVEIRWSIEIIHVTREYVPCSRCGMLMNNQPKMKILLKSSEGQI
jgi:hypothetical protein